MDYPASEREGEHDDQRDWVSIRTAVRVYDVVTFLGFFALVFTLFPATFSRRIHRSRAWFSFVSSWVVFAFSFLLLLDNQFEDTAHFGTCVLQMILVYSSPVLVGSTGLAFILDTYYALRGAILGTLNRPMVYRDLMLIMPWVAWILMIFVTSFLIGQPNQIERDPTHMYCHSKTSAQLIVTLCMAFPLTAACIILELIFAHFLWRNWVALRVYISEKPDLRLRQHRHSVSMMIRLGVFTTMPVAALGLAAYIAAHERETMASWNILLASLPLMVALSFGTQKDILRFYSPRSWWRRCYATDDEDEMDADSEPMQQYSRVRSNSASSLLNSRDSSPPLRPLRLPTEARSGVPRQTQNRTLIVDMDIRRAPSPFPTLTVVPPSP